MPAAKALRIHGGRIGGIIRSITDYPDVPGLDDEVRQRLVRRFGDGVQSWLEELPGRLLVLRERWSLEFDSVIPKGSMSVVIRSRTRQGQRAVLKISPDRERVAKEITGLARWSTTHVPTVLRTDPSMGALLMEEIEPGTPLQDSGTRPSAISPGSSHPSTPRAHPTPTWPFRRSRAESTTCLPPVGPGATATPPWWRWSRPSCSTGDDGWPSGLPKNRPRRSFSMATSLRSTSSTADSGVAWSPSTRLRVSATRPSMPSTCSSGRQGTSTRSAVAPSCWPLPWVLTPLGYSTGVLLSLAWLPWTW
ncbi:MAG: hypothetical protein E6I75_30980 [Chloroflexi bacterium]|nr:MAG: hypothetical protein E6I75_30980 [Chloroflexota bacterium]